MSCRIVVACLSSLPLWGQAFTSERGQIDVGLGYQYSSVRDHSYSHGETKDVGHIRDLGVTPDITIGLTDRATLRVGLPLAIGKYVGSSPHPTILDDGAHGATSAATRTRPRKYTLLPVGSAGKWSRWW